MPYIGNTAGNRFVASKAATQLSGNGSNTTFTLEHSVASDEDILVSVDGVIQEPSIAYSVSNGTTLTFTAAPSNNSGNNIFVYYLFRTVATVDHPSTSSLQATDATFSGAVTANAGVNIDNITIDGTEIDLSSGNLTIDVDGQLVINSDSGQVVLQDDTVNWGNLQNSSGDFIIGSLGADKDIKIQGLDGSSTIDALTLDMSAAGAATFNGNIITNGNILQSADNSSNTLSGGSASNTGGNINVYGSSHSSLASNIRFRSGSTVTMLMDSSGAMTKPLQPAFHVANSSNQDNLADNTVLTFDTEIFDQNDDFASNTFTAPVTGKYQLQLHGRFDQIDKDANYVRIELITSNRGYYASIIDPGVFGYDPTYWSFNFGVLADMDAGDTAYLQWGQSGGASIADKDTQVHFTGYLVA